MNTDIEIDLDIQDDIEIDLDIQESHPLPSGKERVTASLVVALCQVAPVFV